jgi:hypothetical protein
MAEKLFNLVSFSGDKLFNGSVNIDWFLSDSIKSDAASKAFVFHGPKYHGVRQEDVGAEHGHKLIDTASFSYFIARRCFGLEEQPFTLAIAGYGSGKSHLGLTLSNVFSSPNGFVAKEVISSMEKIDAEIGKNFKSILKANNKPCLVVALNGMQKFGLSAEITRQILCRLKKDGLDVSQLEGLKPRFKIAISSVRIFGQLQREKEELLKETQQSSIEEIIDKLEQHDDEVYASVHKFLECRGLPIQVASGESVKDIIDLVSREYCGSDKHYSSLVIFFDEFGKYVELTAEQSYLTGSGVLQELFEGVQANSERACFVGFIQFELPAYLQRVSPKNQAEIQRYITTDIPHIFFQNYSFFTQQPYISQLSLPK